MGFKPPAAIAKAIDGVGVKKAAIPIPQMFVLAFFAGVYIGFGAILATTVLILLSVI